jgi:thiol-disulfide isomerase/thioredoxin
MKKQWIIVVAILAILTAAAVAGIRMAPEIFPVEVGSRAPHFSAIDLRTGDSVSLDQFRGQVVLVNVWATWCDPCRREMPSMQRLHEAFGDSVKILAVSIDEADPQVVKDFYGEYALTFPMFQDRSRAIERIYQTSGVPESFVLNRQGRIVKKLIGEQDWSSPANRELFSRLLAQRG